MIPIDPFLLEPIGVDGGRWGTMVTGQGADGGGGVAGIVVYCSTIVVLVVVNHHLDLKSTPPKFFTRPKFFP